MFKIAQESTFKWPVTVHVPKDGGKFTKASFTAEFKALPQDEIDEVIADARDGRTDSNFAATCLVGWKGVQDESGEEMEFDDDNKDKLLNIPYVRNAVVTAFFEALSGVARRKN